MRGLRRVIIRMVFLVGLFALVGVGVNLLRPSPLAWVADTPYDTLVPCPEGLGHADELKPGDPLLSVADSMVVDARAAAAFTAWHYPRATSVPFDYLEPPPADMVRAILKSGARRVIVYGDGDDPDSGIELARELAGQGVRNVFYVAGGAPALGQPSRTDGSSE